MLPDNSTLACYCYCNAVLATRERRKADRPFARQPNSSIIKYYAQHTLSRASLQLPAAAGGVRRAACGHRDITASFPKIILFLLLKDVA